MPARIVPNEIKRAKGNPGHRALPTPVAFLPRATDIPPEPGELTQLGSETWTRIWMNCRAWISPITDLAIMTRYIETLELRELVKEDVVEGEAKVSDLLRVDASLLQLEARLGLTPADRSRLGKAEIERETAVQKLRTRSTGPRSKTDDVTDAEVTSEHDDTDTVPAEVGDSA